MTTDAAGAASKQTFLERMLDGIERAGNKMPDPAILFLALCGAVIVISQILYWFNVQATYQVVKPPPVPTEETYYGGSTEPTDVGPTEPRAARGVQGQDRDRQGQGLARRATASASSSRRSSRTSGTSPRSRSCSW